MHMRMHMPPPLQVWATHYLSSRSLEALAAQRARLDASPRSDAASPVGLGENWEALLRRALLLQSKMRRLSLDIEELASPPAAGAVCTAPVA